jgi:TRAP transporter TAXI family solute receptor
MRPNRRRLFFVITACLLACLAIGAVVGWFFFAHITLRVATGPMGGAGQKFFAAFVRAVADAHPRVRLKLVPTTDRESSEKALIDDKADLAVLRSDMLTNPQIQTIAILRRDVVGIIIPSHAPIEKVRDLEGKTIGVLQGATDDEHILDQILTYYQVQADKVQRVALAPADITPAIRQKRVAAMFALGPAGPGPLTDVVAAVAKASKGTLTILEIDAADVMAKRFPGLESADIPAGAFGTNPLRPDENASPVTTVSVTMRLVARASMPNYVAGEVARLLFATKAKLASTLPQVSAIEVPDTIVGATLPFHPGAAAYYNGDMPNLLEMFEDYIYLGAIIFSVIGAVFAWMMSAWRRALSQDQEQLLRLLSIVQEVPTADSETLEALDKEVEAIHARAVERVAHEAIEPEQFQVVSQVVFEVRQVIDKRRTRLP